MDETPAMRPTRATASVVAGPTDDRATSTRPCPVADTMRRVHAELRRGAAPSFEALLALGDPAWPAVGPATGR